MKFALFIIATIVSIVLALIAFISGNWPIAMLWIIQAVLNADGANDHSI